jgi:DnaJ-class molecular chaperone
MAPVHTHYDNLKVTRNAPPEVIRAAYRSLSQKFHPDRNPENPNATRTFQMISQAYEVLSDPLKRRDHDDWIAATEANAAPDPAVATAAKVAGVAREAGARSPLFAQSAGASSSTWSAQTMRSVQTARRSGKSRQPGFDMHRWRRHLWAVQGYVSTTRARMNLLHLSRLFFCVAIATLIAIAIFVDY